MSTSATRTETIDPNVVTPTTSEPQNPQPQNAAEISRVHRWDEIASNMSQASRLGMDGKEFVEKLSDYFARKSPDIKLVKIPYSKVECYAAVTGTSRKLACPLIFSETYFSSQSFIPPTEYMPDIAEVFKNMESYDNYRIVQYDVVDGASGDYKRPDLWGSHIHNVFAALEPANKMTYESFKEMKLTASTDLKATLNWINAVSPHGVPERADWGVLISRLKSPTTAAGYNNKKDFEPEPIIGFTGYTRFLLDVSTRKYRPICIITNITANVPHMDIINLALPIAAGTIINQAVWERPYCKFTKGSPNLGMLRLTADMKSIDCFSNLEAMRAELGTIMPDPPLLAIDCAEGRARIPGLEQFLIFGNKGVSEAFSEFYKSILPASSPLFDNSVLYVIRNYEGTYKTNGQIVDTRNGDFINMVMDTKDPNRVRSSLQVFPMENRHLQDIASIYGDETVTPLYRVSTIIFNNALISEIAGAMSNIVNYSCEGPIDQSIDMGQIMRLLSASPISGNNSFFGGYTSISNPANIYR